MKEEIEADITSSQLSEGNSSPEPRSPDAFPDFAPWIHCLQT